jgi:iron complex outermembrane receptor protein
MTVGMYRLFPVKIAVLLCSLLVSVLAHAGDDDNKTGSIKGTITTSDNKTAAGITVLLKPLKKGMVTREDGSFAFTRLQPGAYVLEISLLGYETIEQPVELQEGESIHRRFQLKISDRQLQEVTIKTARNPYSQRNASAVLRLNEPLLEAPQNIQVVTAKALADQQIISMSDGVLRNVSGAMRIEHWADLYTNIHMRGSQVSSLRNGMNIATSYWSPLTEDMSIVDHIEFVKGPAGFLMPVGDPAGLYNVVTKKPTGVTKGEAGFMFGSYGLYRATLDLDGKLDKDGRLLYRLNLAGKNQNSFRPYEFNNRYVVNPVISYKIDDKTTLTAEYLLQKVKMSDVGSYYVFSVKGYGDRPRNFTTADPGIEPTHITDQTVTLGLQRVLAPGWKLTAQASYFDYKQQGSDLWPAYVGADSMIRGLTNWDAASTAKYGQVFVNGEAQTGSLHHRVLVGLDISDKKYVADWNQTHQLDTEADKFSLDNPVYWQPANGYPSFDRTTPLIQRAGLYGVTAQTYTGVYVQDEIGFWHNTLRLTLAGRYSYVNNNDFNSIGTAKKITPRVGASVSIDKNTTAYALFDQAFVPQSGIKKDHSSIKPLNGNNMEIGLKRDWLNGKWNTTLSAYRIIRKNVNSTDPSDPTGRFVVQLGETTSKGVELDVRGEIVPGLTLMANYAYTDAKVTKADTSEAGKATLGKKVSGYATHTANAWLNYQLNKGTLKGLGLSAGLSFLGDRNTWDWNATAKPMQLPDYTKLDAGIFWDNSTMRIALNVFNLANRFLYSGAPYGNYYYWQAEAGRNWRLSLSYRF